VQRSSESIACLSAALAKAQAELTNPEKSLVATIRGKRPGEGERSFRYAPGPAGWSRALGSLSAGPDIWSAPARNSSSGETANSAGSASEPLAARASSGPGCEEVDLTGRNWNVEFKPVLRGAGLARGCIRRRTKNGGERQPLIRRAPGDVAM
jgi:hypothetical protein